MGKAIVRSGPLEVLKAAAGPYAPQVRAFVEYLEESGYSLKEGIPGYLAELKGRKRSDREGRKVSYSPAWWNQNLKALKWSVRCLLDHSPALTIPERWAVEQELKKLKRRAPKVGIAKADRVPTAGELKTLEEKADPRLSLMIRFLEATSCRVSEMLGAEVGKARRGARITCSRNYWEEGEGAGSTTSDPSLRRDPNRVQGRHSLVRTFGPRLQPGSGHQPHPRTLGQDYREGGHRSPDPTPSRHSVIREVRDLQGRKRAGALQHRYHQDVLRPFEAVRC